MTNDATSVRSRLTAAVTGAASPLAAADRLCQVCVETLDVDGAALSLTHEGTTRGTFGSSSSTSRTIDELQYTYGEGPCLQAAFTGVPVLVADLAALGDVRWPAFRRAVMDVGVAAVFALPVAIMSTRIGALDLYRQRRGPLTADDLVSGLFAAELAALPLLDLVEEVDWDDAGEGGQQWHQLASLERVEVYQATGMLVGALDVSPEEALVRLRGYAFSHNMTASEVAYAIVEGDLLGSDEWRNEEG